MGADLGTKYYVNTALPQEPNTHSKRGYLFFGIVDVLLNGPAIITGNLLL
jgi:hypothetical protein